MYDRNHALFMFFFFLFFKPFYNHDALCTSKPVRSQRAPSYIFFFFLYINLYVRRLACYRIVSNGGLFFYIHRYTWPCHAEDLPSESFHPCGHCVRRTPPACPRLDTVRRCGPAEDEKKKKNSLKKYHRQQVGNNKKRVSRWKQLYGYNQSYLTMVITY